MIRLDQQKKTLGQNIDPTKSYGQMNSQNILIHKGNLLNQKNCDLILTIIFARINILTQFFLLIKSNHGASFDTKIDEI